ncbi:hypothetical protein F5148DRAFT_243683 [Russula earlei]|uniref:Uncharacterized protein n=1 Tax=Russula earlei TaxID=71964 RepID=A0ACC0U3I1_9AGAM|nr:hypothetical protein F5148DRAFT_243683 [Russula earlei]
MHTMALQGKSHQNIMENPLFSLAFDRRTCSLLLRVLSIGRRANVAASKFQAGYLYLPASGARTSNPDAFVLPQTLLGKRRLDEDNGLDDGSPDANNSEGRQSHKKGKAKMASTIGVLDAGRSINRTRCKPAARTLTDINRNSKALGRGFTTPNAQGIYHQFLQGPNVQQEWMSRIAQGKLPRVKERAGSGVTPHGLHGAAARRQQREQRGAGGGKSSIPNLKTA